ncbi:MAG: hypothetical protein KIG84_07010, partial [Bacteroidales bacterium]|nr:hypothetical protein [Bacteroidales bacterium]
SWLIAFKELRNHLPAAHRPLPRDCECKGTPFSLTRNTFLLFFLFFLLSPDYHGLTQMRTAQYNA